MTPLDVILALVGRFTTSHWNFLIFLDKPHHTQVSLREERRGREREQAKFSNILRLDIQGVFFNSLYTSHIFASTLLEKRCFLR